MRKPASKEVTSGSVELCETEVCVLHIQLMGTNVRVPKIHRILPDVDCGSTRSPGKCECLEQSQSTVLYCVAILFVVTRIMNVGCQTSQALVTGSFPFCD